MASELTVGKVSIGYPAAAQTDGSLVGQFDFIGKSSDETPVVARIKSEGTATAGSGKNCPADLTFWTQPAGGTELTKRLTIDSTGTTAITTTGDVKSILCESTATTNSALQISGDSLTTGRLGYFYSAASDTGTRSLVWIRNDHASATGTTCLKVTNDSTGPAIELDGGGIKFPATQSASADANTLDDYEEGVFSPLLTDGTNNATMNATYNFGKYTRIGDVVTLTAYVVTSSLGSVSGNVHITGIPFAAASGFGFTNGGSVGSGGGLAITAGQAITVGVGQGGSLLYLRVWDATTGSTEMQESEWTADGNIQLTITYKAA